MKRSIKQLLSAVLVVAMIASLLVVPAAAAEPQVLKTWDIENAASGVFDGTFTEETPSELDGLKLVGKGRRQSGHGAQFYMNGYIEIPVTGDCQVKVSTNYKLDIYLGDDASKAVTDTNKVAILSYKGGAGTVKLRSNSDANTYITKIELLEAATEPAVTAPAEVTGVKVGDTKTVTVGIDNADDKEVSWTYSVTGDAIARDTVESTAEGEVSFTAAKAGKATLTVEATVDGQKYSKNIVVYVAPTTIREVADGDTLTFSGADGKTDLYASEFATVVSGYHGTQYGLDFKGANAGNPSSVTMKVPSNKKANITVTGSDADNGVFTAKHVDGATEIAVTKGENYQYTITGATGTVVIGADAQMYLTKVQVALVDLAAPSMTVSPSDVTVKVGETADVTVTAEHYGDKTPFAVSADTTVATATVAADGKKVTIEGVKAGATAVYVVMADTQPTLAEALANDSVKKVTVAVAPAGAREVGNETIDFTGVDGETTLKTTDAVVYVNPNGQGGWHGKDHGVNVKPGDTFTLKVPADKTATITMLGCEFGSAGYTAKDSNGDLTISLSEEVVGEGDNAETCKRYTVKGAAGTVVFTSKGQEYLHGIKIELTDSNAPSLTVSPTSVTMREKESKDVKVEAKNYADTFKPFAVSADAAVATATLAADGKSVSITGVKEGTTKVYVGMAETAPADATAAAAVEGVETVAVTVEPPLAEGVKVWDFSDPAWTEQTGTIAEYKGLVMSGITVNKTYALGKTGSTIAIPVDGPCKVTVSYCYSASGVVGDTAFGTTSGSTSTIESTTGTYTGGKGTAAIIKMTTKPGDDSTYITKIEVEPLEGITPNSVDVWDFGAEALNTALFNNKLTVENITAQYPEGTEAKAGITIPVAGFNFYDGALKFNTNEKDNNRLRTTNTAVPRYDEKSLVGAVGADPYLPDEVVVNAENGEVTGGETYTGYIYSNSGSQPLVNLTMQLTVGDKVTFVSGSNGNAEHYELKAPSGAIDSAEFLNAAKAEPLTFFAKETGEYTYYGTNEKLVVARIYQEPGVKVTVTGNVDQSKATGLTGEYSVVFTGPGGVETKAPVKDGKYTIELNNYLGGADYVVSLEGADGFIVAQGEEFSLSETDRTGSHDIIVAAVDLVTVTGKVAGLGEADLANVKLVITKPEDKIYQPKIVPAADGSFTASFEKGVEYAVEALNVNDYELVKDKLTFTADKTENVIFVPKTTYTVTMAPDPATVDLSAATIIFTNVDEVDAAHEGGYVYTFTGADGIKLRDAQYVVEVKGASGIQKLTPDLVVAGSDTECTVPFLVETPTLWDFSDATWSSQSGEIPTYNGLVMSGVMVNKTYALGNAGASIQIPVDGACTVTVSYCYKANGTVGDVAFSTDSGSTGTIESASYKYTGEKGTVELKYVDQSYLTKIEVIKSTPYAETVTVGADKQYKTINEALAAVKTMERTAEQRVTILIDPGDYEEMLRIDVPNITLKNASATPSIELTNKGVDIDANAVRITSYYGHGYAYYSMESDCSYSAERLAVNKANGRLSFENPGTGTTSGSYWNATVRIMASGVRAEDIIFENSFNQYVSKKAAEDVIVKLAGAKEGAVPRAEMKAGDTTVQHKEYVERAAALAINNGCKNIFFDNCRFVGRQDTLYGGVDSTVGFYKCKVMGGTDYIFGGMNAVFAKCDLIFNTNDETAKGQKDDVGYITAPQQAKATDPGYLMYNCHVTSTTPGVDTASNFVSKPGLWGRPWNGNKSEAVFYATNVDATDPSYFTGDTAKGTSMIQGIGWNSGLSSPSDLCGDYDTVEYYEGADTSAERISWAAKFTEAKTADGDSMTDTKAWLGGWDAFAGKDMTVEKQTPKPFTAEAMKEDLTDEIAAAEDVYAIAVDTKADDVTAADVDRGDEFVNAKDKEALKAAIAAAKAVNEKADATVAEVVKARTDLAKAVQAYQVAVKKGAKAPDTTALKTALDAAATAKAGVVITSGPADKVVKDVAFAPKTAFDALNNAIRSAEKVLNGAASTQADVDAAKTALDAAIAAFNAAKGVGTKAADAASLKAAIEAATAAKEGVVVNAGPADQVEAGTKFVTDKAVIDALDKAIAAAQAVADKANATQAELDAALKALTIAKADFDASVQTGTKGGVEADKAALSAAIDAAKGVYAIGDDVKVEPAGTKASDVTRGQKFVTQDAVDALAKAIADAEAVLAKEGATQEEIDAAVAALNAAVETFQKAIKTGTKGSIGGGGSSSSSSSATTTTKTNANGQTVKKTTNRNGDVVYTVTDKNGDVIAKVELPASVPATTKKFKDVPENHWAEKSINDLAALGMVNGVADEVYDMASPVTRGSVATILFRLAQAKGVAADFSDVAEGAWYAEAVGWAAKYGVVNGFEDGTFKADSSITREQLAVMLYRFANLLAVDTKATGNLGSFADAEGVSDWAKDAMTWAVGAGIIKGNDAKELNATDAATRAETACMVDRFIALLK